jgi:hypothetical protein
MFDQWGGPFGSLLSWVLIETHPMVTLCILDANGDDEQGI